MKSRFFSNLPSHRAQSAGAARSLANQAAFVVGLFLFAQEGVWSLPAWAAAWVFLWTFPSAAERRASARAYAREQRQQRQSGWFGSIGG